MIVSWFSAGVSSAVVTKIALKKYKKISIIYFDIEDQHPDTYRFISDCEKWFGQKIEYYKSDLGSVENACLMASYLRGVRGAACTTRLKRKLRMAWESKNKLLPLFDGLNKHVFIWGMDNSETSRANDIIKYQPNAIHEFPLIEKNITKENTHSILAQAGIKRPAMYELGYPNNNCIGCLKGGMGYWNKIRIDFPEVFSGRAKLERRIGARILKECYLDELDPNRGRDVKIILPDCGASCADWE